jgi:lysine 2,3-aminomutase
MKYSNKEITKIAAANTFADLPDAISGRKNLEELKQLEIPDPIKEPVNTDDLVHRQFLSGNFWSKIPAYAKISEDEFRDFKFQNKNTIRRIAQLQDSIRELVSKEFLEDVEKGLEKAPMNLSVSPYLLSLINWNDPYNDPLRKQFIPVYSQIQPDHPRLTLDSLCEQDDSPVPGLVHRYFDKVLFLPLDVCPVYCRFCTRSYAIGGDTESVDKLKFQNAPKKWNDAFTYIASRPEVEDVVISGGDSYMLAPMRLRLIGEMLLEIPHVRRLRFATKGPAVMPMKILSDHKWTNTLVDIVNQGREKGKEVVVHTHFNSVNEITDITREAMIHLFKQGVTVRNQSVLIKDVNDSVESMIHLIRKLSYMDVQPYYVYQHDMVEGTEDMRTSIAKTVELEKNVRGVTAGFNTPLFVTDAPGGGGKRDVHSYDYYDKVTGISVYRSPSVDSSKLYLYFDPINSLPAEGRKLWEDNSLHDDLIQNAINKSGYKSLSLA